MTKKPLFTEIFRLVWRGWFVGVMALGGPVAIIITIVFLLTGQMDKVAGALGTLIIAPAIIAFQGLVVALLVSIGYAVSPPPWLVTE